MKAYPDSYSSSDAVISDSNFAILSSQILERYSDEMSEDKQAIFKVTYENKQIGYNTEVYVSVKEFSAPEDTIYLNMADFDGLMCDIGDEVNIEYFDPPSAVLIVLKPLDKEFYNVMDIKSMLETSIISNYPFIKLNQTLKINSQIRVSVESLEPFEICRTNNIDLNVEFVEMDKEPEPETIVEEESDDEEEPQLTREEMRQERLKYYKNK